MSKETWLEEYYPVPSDSAEARSSDRAAIEHSLHKWRGLRPDVLKAHGVMAIGRGLREDMDEEPFIYIAGSSCALCMRHDEICETCPLFNHEDETACDGEGREYHEWTYKHDPEPMIVALEAALEKELAKELKE